MINKKILVLGATGMLGRCVYKYFSKNGFYSVFGTSRVKNKSFYFFDAKEIDSLENILGQTGQVEYIINCIGILKSGPSENFSINYLLPKQLEKLQKKYKFRLIHISTDDVFGAHSGKVNEKSTPSPNNPYALSKLKGEVTSKFSINIRTSIIGFDPSEGKGLIEWLIKNKNKNIQGYTNQNWSGSTTLQFARFCEYLIKNNHFEKTRSKTNRVHFSPLGPITKYKLLKLISEKLNIKVNINKFEAEEKINRNLSSIYFDKKFLQSYISDTGKAIIALKEFEEK